MFGNCDICGREADLTPWQRVEYDEALARDYVKETLFLCDICYKVKTGQIELTCANSCQVTCETNCEVFCQATDLTGTERN